MIDRLTPQQEAQLPVWRDKWIAYGLSTEPADRPRAEEGIHLAYAAANLQPPRIVWCGSPLANALTAGASVGASVGDSVGDSVYGQHDAAWIAWCDYFREVCGLRRETDCLRGLTLLAQSAGWALPYEKICWVSERHNILRRDAQGQPHCSTGHAIEYPDGWGVYAWHGVRVPERVILAPEAYTADEIKAERNTEVVRALAERLGWRTFLQRLGTDVVDSWCDPVTGLDYALHQAHVGVATGRWIEKESPETKQGTRPHYIEPVPADLTTAQAARKWQAMAAFLVDGDEQGAADLVRHCNAEPELTYDWEA